MDMQIQRVKRPSLQLRVNGFQAQLKQTLSSGDALSVRIVEGETYAVTRNRVAGNATHAARKMNASVRTCKSADGLSVLIWLEPKA